MSTTKRLSLTFAMLFVAGCSGGGGTSNVPRATTPVQPGTPVTPQSKMVTVKIHIPAVPAQKTASRHRAYVSPYTNYALVSETDSGYKTELTQVGTDLSASSSACTFDNGDSGARTCAVQISATGGQTDYFEFDTYSVSEASAVAAPDTALSTAVPTANRLGSARTSAAISLDTSNTVNAALGGVVVSYAVSPAVISGDGSQSITGQYSLTALDSSNDVVIAGSADPYTDGTNYPLTFTSIDSPMVVQTGTTPASSFLTVTPGGPDATTATPPTSTFSQSGDYLSASYDAYTNVSSYYDTITFTATNSTIANPTQSALFAPIFLDGSSAAGGATFSQNDTNPSGSEDKAPTHRSRALARGRALRRFESSGGAGNNYPIVSFTGSGQSVVITPSEYTGSSPAQTFTPMLASGCTVPTGSKTGPTVTVAPVSGTPGAFTVTATAAAQTSADGGYTATDANGQPITACSISFADSNGNSALLEVTNTQSTSTIAIDPGTLVTSNGSTGEITLFDTSQSLAQITQFKGEANAPIGVEKDGLGNVYVAQNNQIFQYTPSSYASQNPDATAVTFETEGADPSGNQLLAPYFTTLAYHETNSSTHTGTLIAGDGNNGRVYFFSTTAANTPIGSGSATSNYIQIPANGGNTPEVTGVAFDAQGDVYVGALLTPNGSFAYFIYEYAASTADSGSASVSSKPIRTIALGQGMHLYGIALDGVGNVFAADTNNGSIYEFQTYPTANNTGTPNVTITSACTAMSAVAVATASDGTDSVYGGCQGNLNVYLATGITTSSASPTATLTSATGNVVAF